MEQKTYPTLRVAKPSTLVFWCGDPRIQEAVNQFLREELGLKYGEYLPITVLGGVASFSEPLSIPKEAKYMRDAAEFCLDHFESIHKVILINHEDCAKYKAVHERLGSRFLQGFVNLNERQLHDLMKVGEVIADLASHPLVLERYYGRFTTAEHTQLFFEKQ